MIEVHALDSTTFEGIVGGRTTTTHRVTVRPEYGARLAGARGGAQDPVRRSFERLLEREDNTRILRRFDLAVIARYFPEYERVIRERS
jgi:hypothetical protein